MRPFDYESATDPAEAVGKLVAVADASPSAVQAPAQFIAGGTTLLDLMKIDVMQPRRLVDINHVPVAAIQPGPDGGLRLGALATNTAVAYNPEVERRYPLLSRAILALTSRTAATMLG
jgi:xanthine dehydrogenase YagS FAD-binding subunit